MPPQSCATGIANHHSGFCLEAISGSAPNHTPGSTLAIDDYRQWPNRVPFLSAARGKLLNEQTGASGLLLRKESQRIRHPGLIGSEELAQKWISPEQS